ncbi:MAG: hypothetical protein Q8R37_03370 [Nanoarchaeota archaeon]|nr:hypothetical protein [Nanoarchaeota archaeon]
MKDIYYHDSLYIFAKDLGSLVRCFEQEMSLVQVSQDEEDLDYYFSMEKYPSFQGGMLERSDDLPDGLSEILGTALEEVEEKIPMIISESQAYLWIDSLHDTNSRDAIRDILAHLRKNRIVYSVVSVGLYEAEFIGGFHPHLFGYEFINPNLEEETRKALLDDLDGIWEPY